MGRVRGFFSGIVLLFLILATCCPQAAAIFSPRTGPIIFPHHVQDPKYAVNILGEKDSPEENSRLLKQMEDEVSAGKESVIMTNASGYRFLCLLPPPPVDPKKKGKGSGEDGEESSRISQDGTSALSASSSSVSLKGEGGQGGSPDTATTRRSPESLLDSMAGLPCFYRVEGWWTYELCFKKHLRQYHSEKDQVVAEFYLGLYDKEASEELYERHGGEAFLQKDPSTDTAAQRYHAHVYANGTECDLTGQLRQTEVRYICSEDGQNFLSSIKEAPTCRYTLLFHTSLLCNHQWFKKEAAPVNGINCRRLPADQQLPSLSAELANPGSPGESEGAVEVVDVATTAEITSLPGTEREGNGGREEEGAGEEEEGEGDAQGEDEVKEIEELLNDL
eukprot:TRINITY_DN32793_c0_g1_i1.p1 TRINITY_DN32793_c0_g1~~TRINITY_DN32793_c0_g1_i1.p1  ORF type:complete len:391 (-),score=89.62 TRINITY_DN32793_c0_g1_i1:756-1928(-)